MDREYLAPGEATLTSYPYPVPNKADAAWERLQQLRAQARELGVDVDQAMTIAELEELIEAHR